MIRLLLPDPKLQQVAREVERAIRQSQAQFDVLPDDYADDTAAAAGGVPLNGVYRTGSALKVRVS